MDKLPILFFKLNKKTERKCAQPRVFFSSFLENPHMGDVLGMSIYKQRENVKGTKRPRPSPAMIAG
ncbi:MAG: hypothetical protein A2534_05320 [Candidatus Magasanikbacteria bacterium RIFOXYD2_FULL_39_9]|nr:MAG: hypothetical protein A2534_05320 [Candidatus Magasanikbacteria bacterium RIFOXYD2_FULL_39_9]